MEKKIVIGISILAVVLIIMGVFIFLPNNSSDKNSQIKRIRYSDKNSTALITQNNLDKTASIDMEVFIQEGQVGSILKNFCVLIQMAFFNETALEKFNEVTESWNQADGIVENEKGEEIGTFKGNPLKDYQINKVNLYVKNQNTNEVLIECAMTGPSEDDLQVNYF